MPVTTTVYIHDRADYRIVFARCAVLTGTPAQTPTSDHGGMISTSPDRYLYAWTWVEYGQDGLPLRATTAPHNQHCVPGCRFQHAPACWIEAAFDTSDSYRGDPGTLHHRLITGLGQWLDTQAIKWSWRNHSEGILHDQHADLAGMPFIDQ